jgi:YgiT-type zinc finger domain-containing protein
MKTSKPFGDCIYCGGEVTEKFVQKVCSRGGRLIAVIDEVPAGVCTQCGERFYQSDVLERIEAILANIDLTSEHIRLPLSKYAA